MKRPVGVTVSAIFLIVGSLFLTSIAVMLAFAGFVLTRGHTMPGAVSPAMPPGVYLTVMLSEASVLLAMAAWAVATAVGLFRLRPWARVSTLIIGGGIALINSMLALTFLALTLVPLPAPPGMNREQAQAMHSLLPYLFGSFAALSLLLVGLGGWFIYYFVRKPTAAVFAAARPQQRGDILLAEPGTAPALASSPRPLLITILAVLCFIGAAFCVLGAMIPLPALLFGLILWGWQKALLYLFFAILQVAAGLGLWRLRPWGRILAFIWAGWGVVTTIALLAFPSGMLRYQDGVRHAFGTAASPAMPPLFQTYMAGIGIGFSLLWCGGIIWVLLHYRAAFHSGWEPIES